MSGARSLSDGEALDGGLLLGETEGGLVGLADLLGLLDAVELNVAVGGEVGRDATMGTVRPSAAGDSALHNGVADHAVVDVQLGGLSVGLQVDEELADSLEGLLGPATLGVLELFALGVTADTTGVASEGDNLLVLKAVVQVHDGPLQLQALDGTCHFVSVLVVSAEVADSALSSCSRKKVSYTIDKKRKRTLSLFSAERGHARTTTYIWQAQLAV